MTHNMHFYIVSFIVNKWISWKIALKIITYLFIGLLFSKKLWVCWLYLVLFKSKYEPISYEHMRGKKLCSSVKKGAKGDGTRRPTVLLWKTYSILKKWGHHHLKRGNIINERRINENFNLRSNFFRKWVFPRLF